MNATMITQEKSLSINSILTDKLIDLVSNYYQISLNELEKSQIQNMSFETKSELLDFYRPTETVANNSFELNIL